MLSSTYSSSPVGRTGSDCDGHPADFSVKVGDSETLGYFRAPEDGDVTLNKDYPEDPYEGSEFRRDGLGNSEGGRWLWAPKPKVSELKADRPEGSWEQFCTQFCDVTLTEEVSNSKTETTSESSETRKALSVALEAGIDFPGGKVIGGASVKTTVTSEEEATAGRTMSRELE